MMKVQGYELKAGDRLVLTDTTTVTLAAVKFTTDRIIIVDTTSGNSYLLQDEGTYTIENGETK